MKSTIKNKMLSMALCCFTMVTCAANTWWVEDESGVDASGYGTEISPFKTIQYAINTASAGDTIFVKPGTYATGGRSYGNSNYTQPARVYINKRLYIKSTQGREVRSRLCFKGTKSVS